MKYNYRSRSQFIRFPNKGSLKYEKWAKNLLTVPNNTYRIFLCKNHFSKEDFDYDERLKTYACPSVEWKNEFYPVNKSNTSKYPPAQKAQKSLSSTTNMTNKKRCLIKTCASATTNDMNCKYIRFPEKGSAKYIEWIIALGLDASNCGNLSGYLCEKHFRREDFKFGCLQSEAVPTYRLEGTENDLTLDDVKIEPEDEDVSMSAGGSSQLYEYTIAEISGSISNEQTDVCIEEQKYEAPPEDLTLKEVYEQYDNKKVVGSAPKTPDSSLFEEIRIKNEPLDDLATDITNNVCSDDFLIGSSVTTECSIEIELSFGDDESDEDLISIVSMAESDESDEEKEISGAGVMDIGKCEESPQINTPTVKKPRRPRMPRNEKLWKQNIAKSRRQKGQEYFSMVSKKTVPAKTVQDKSCKCPMKCNSKFSDLDRQTINSGFWDLSNVEKKEFFAKFVTKSYTQRKRGKLNTKKRLYAYRYHFEIRGGTYQVCQSFFLNTLHISSRQIYSFFTKVVDKDMELARFPLSVKHGNTKISEEQKEKIKSHITSFPLMPAHCCLCDSQKMYFTNDIRSIQQLYYDYVLASQSPVKTETYRKIFASEFKISFYVPKKDICNKCADFNTQLSTPPQEHEKHNKHIQQTEIAKIEKKKDLDETQHDPSSAVLSFGLGNALNFPMGNTATLLFQNKWCSFNLTGMSNKSSSVYNALWHEGMIERGVDDIVSALIKILKAFLEENPLTKKLILWSDICVAHNRNSFMSSALLNFLHRPESLKLETIIHKYCETGHSCITEIDRVHNIFSRRIRNNPIGSHPSLIKILKGYPPSKKKQNFLVLDMRPDDFKQFRSYAEIFNFEGLPFAQSNYLKYDINTESTITYRHTFDGPDISFKLTVNNTHDRKLTVSDYLNQPVSNSEVVSGVSEQKVKDIISMFPYMQLDDIEFYFSLREFEEYYQKLVT